MGAEESKGHAGGGGGALARSSSWGGQTGSVKRVNYPNSCRNETEARAWSLLHHCSLEDWQQGHAEKANFGEGVLTCEGTLYKECSFSFCMSRQGIIDIDRTGSVFSFRRRSRFAKMAEHFEYNHIPAQMSSINKIRVKGVLCFRDRLVVLHLARNANSQFGALDLCCNKFLALFGKQSLEFSNAMLAGEISPDLSRCMIRLPATSTADTSSAMYLYDVRSGALLRHLAVNTASVGACLDVAFDPRYTWRRVAITGFAAGQLNSLSLVDVDTWSARCTNTRVDDTQPLQPRMRHLMYSRDGALVVVVIAAMAGADQRAAGACTCRAAKRARTSLPSHPTACSIYVLSGDTACTLHCVRYHRAICARHSCPVNYTPLLSACASRLAVLMDPPPRRRQERRISNPPPPRAVHVYKLPPTCPTLQAGCRVVILQWCPPHQLNRLPLPTRLYSFLNFEPLYD